MKQLKTSLPAALLAGTIFAAPALAQQERQVTLDTQTGIAVTIYNANLAMVRDYRTVTLTKGVNRLAFVDVSGRIRPETAILTGGAKFKLAMLEQNFNYDLLTPAKLLEKSVGKTVRVVRIDPETKKEVVETATVLSTVRGVVLKIGDRIYTGVPGRLIFDKIPENLRARPTLSIDLDSSAAGKAAVELTYLTRGLAWRADYVAVLNDAETAFDLNGWITLNNQSGTTYKNATLQLVAGDVNQVRGRVRSGGYRDRAAESKRSAAPRRQAVGDYYLYTIARPTTIANNQQKQVALMKAAGVTVTKQYRFTGISSYYRYRAGGEHRVKANVWLTFTNDKKSNLGDPLPKGVVRVYKRAKDGKAVFLGEDRIGHTAENEAVRLKLGQAFDVSGVRVQTAYARQGLSRNVYETAYRITLQNAKPTEVTVLVTEPIPGDWRVLSETHRHKKVNSNTAEWAIKIPAKGKTVLEYRVRVTY